MYKKCIALCLIFFFHFFSLYAHNLIQDAGSWNKLRIKGRVPKTERLRYWLEPNLRLIFTKNAFFESVNRIALGYHFGKHKTIWQGYTINPFDKQGRSGLEHRVWQELYLGFYPNDVLHVSSRTRLEARWINTIPGNAWRLRQRILLKFKHPNLEPVRPVIFDEIFFNLSHPLWVAKSALNQNRAFVGFDYYFNKPHLLRIGYLNRFTTSRLEKNLLLHLIWLAIHFKFD